jgi:hypothetical protein
LLIIGAILEKSLTLTVFPVEIKPMENQYSEGFKTGMFKETIRISVDTCVYRQWESTQYAVDTLPMATYSR